MSGEVEVVQRCIPIFNHLENILGIIQKIRVQEIFNHSSSYIYKIKVKFYYIYKYYNKADFCEL